MPTEISNCNCAYEIKTWKSMTREERKMYWRERKYHPIKHIEEELLKLNKI